jgi:hypothetical protein
MNINYPWYLYPNPVCCGYSDYDEYKKETIRLYQFLENDKLSKNTILQLIIGATMEEAREFEQDIDFQWRQLLPFYLEDHIEKNPDDTIKLLIVSPNKNFASDKINENTIKFIKETPYFKWKFNNENKTYYSSLFNISVHIFCTFFPSKQINNKLLLSKINDSGGDIVKKYTQQLIQTDTDCQFIDLYYKSLSNYFTKIEKNNGLVLCVSYANFRHGGLYSKYYKEYDLFTEIKILFKNHKNRILSNWVFINDRYVTNIFNSSKMISYVIPSYEYSDGEFPIFNLENSDKIKLINPHMEMFLM